MSQNFNLYVGSSTGTLKGVTVGKDKDDISTIHRNLVTDKENISNKNEIKCMNWSNELNEEILIGMKNKVQIYHTTNEEFSEKIDLPFGECCGIFKEKETLFIGSTSGVISSVQIPVKEASWSETLKTGKSIDRMKRSILHTNIIATGGKDTDLKLWDINTQQMTFAAKNIKPDELQLQIPVWISDITFLHSCEKIATCMRHGYVRLYDPLLPQRRPVFNAFQENQVFTCICETPNDNQFLSGSGSGDLFLVDIRNSASFIGKYKGFCGGVKSIICPPSQNFVYSASLDRHFRIHNFKTRKLVYKDYMLSRLTSLLCKEPFIIEEFKKETSEKDEEEEQESFLPKKKSKDKDKEVLDKLFMKMEKIDEGISKRNITNLKEKKMKKAKVISRNDKPNDICDISPKKIKWKNTA